MKNKKLYLVEIRMCNNASRNYSASYVVAEDSTSAYEKVLQDLKEKDIGFESDRELDSISLLAEDTDYPNCKTKLYI